MTFACNVIPFRASADALQPDSNDDDPIVDDEDEDDEMESEDEEHAVDPIVQSDIRQFEESFRGISKKYRLIDRIGEGA